MFRILLNGSTNLGSKGFRPCRIFPACFHLCQESAYPLRLELYHEILNIVFSSLTTLRKDHYRNILNHGYMCDRFEMRFQFLRCLLIENSNGIIFELLIAVKNSLILNVSSYMICCKQLVIQYSQQFLMEIEKIKVVL